jgi:hypothetical protein
MTPAEVTKFGSPRILSPADVASRTVPPKVPAGFLKSSVWKEKLRTRDAHGRRVRERGQESPDCVPAQLDIVVQEIQIATTGVACALVACAHKMSIDALPKVPDAADQVGKLGRSIRRRVVNDDDLRIKSGSRYSERLKTSPRPLELVVRRDHDTDDRVRAFRKPELLVRRDSGVVAM